MLAIKRFQLIGIIIISSFLTLGATCTEEEDTQEEDVGLSDADKEDVDDDELNCLDIADDEECAAEEHCEVYHAWKMDTEEVLASDQSCHDFYYDGETEYSSFCVRGEWAISDHQAGSAYARYNEAADEYSVYMTSDTPQGHEEMGFYSCGQIPEDGYGEIRELCYECR